MFRRGLHSPLFGTICCCEKTVHTLRLLSISASLAGKQMPRRPQIDDSEITGTYLKGSGPGGQKINKTNSAVQLIHKPTNTVVKSQATRSRSQNQKIARRLLAEKVELMEKGEKSRVYIKAEASRKKKASKAKKSRRKYRALEEERARKEGKEGEGGEEINGVEEVEEIDVEEVVDVKEEVKVGTTANDRGESDSR